MPDAIFKAILDETPYWMADCWIRCVAERYARKVRNTALEPRAQLEEVGYDWFARHEEIVDTQAKADPEIVLLGDETADASSRRFRRRRSWMPGLRGTEEKRLWMSGFCYNCVVNKGASPQENSS